MVFLTAPERERASYIETLIDEHNEKTFRFVYTKDNGDKSERVGKFEKWVNNLNVCLLTPDGYRTFHLYGISNLTWE